MAEEEPIFTIDEGWLYQFMAWLHIEKHFVLVDRRTANTPSFDDMIAAIKEFVEKRRRAERG